MRVNVKLVVLILILNALASCTNDLDSLVHEGDVFIECVEPTTPHHIPISKALSSLESIMESMGMDNTRVMNRSNWTVTRIPMSTFKPQTRTGNTEVADALYVVDFEEGGYAILSADDRLPDEVIAVTNSGDLEFNPNPLEDPVLTLDDLYVEEDEDYLLGSEPRDEGTSEGFIEGLVANYVIGWIDSLRDNKDEFGDPMLPPGGGNIGGGDSGGDIGTGNLIVDYSYETEVVCDKMLQTQWYQRDQYNRYCPNRYRYRGLFGATYSRVEEYDFDPRAEWGDDYIDSVDLAAGCVAIAVGQILAYNQYPTMSYIVGETNAMPWDALLAFDRINHANIYYQDFIAKLIHRIGVGCDMNYGFMGTSYSFATPAAASRYMESIGYSNVKTKFYDFNIVKSMLEQGCPVFVGAVRISGGISGHAWVIDGYKKIEKTKIISTMSGTVISETVEESTDYVHCNWGWANGSNNGWFANNLLKNGCIETSDAESFDNSINDMQKHYNFWFRIIKYNK